MAANAIDQRLHFSAKVGGTIRMGVDGTARELGTSLGPLKSGKYFVQLIGAVTCWVRTGPVGLDDAINQTPNPTGAAQNLVNEFYMNPADGVASFTYHVRNSEKDGQISAIASGAATLLITKIGD